MKANTFLRFTAKWVFVSCVFLVLPGPVEAHQSSFTYGTLTVNDNEVSYELRIDAKDLFEALALTEDRAATEAEIEGGSDKIYRYMNDRIKLEVEGDCEREYAPARAVTDGALFAELVVRIRCAAAPADIKIDYNLFFDLDKLHVGLLRVGKKTFQLKEDARLYIYGADSAPVGFVGFVLSGIDHIVYGPDHVLFLAALLFMVVLRRGSQSEWEVRPLRAQIRTTGLIVTSFTIAHSVTLIAAALGWITLPSALVESVIAASIIYVAIENVVRPDPPHRYFVTFAFGLIHGLGFATMLRPLLPPEDVVVPLLAFNVGVEVGQLAIVCVVLPLLYGVVSKLGAKSYKRWVLPTTAFVLSALGGVWLIERAFSVELLGL